jgi:probable F420-dependent oxidoreductase
VHVDVMTTPQPLDTIGDLARRTQAAGFPGLLFTETGRTAYLNAAVASQAAPGLELSTGVAVAFPRSPFVTAATAWELQEATGGKFRLGLGTQVRTHVVRRYGMEFERPGPRLRDYVRAVKACFTAFRTGKLDHHGEFYNLDFISPQWNAGPIDAADPKVDVAAVNPWMLRMAGEVADGVHVHPLGEPGYLTRHVVPNVAEGAAKSGRSVSDIALIVPVMTIVGDSDEERHKERELARVSMSFYGSTPNYAFIWDEAGFEGTTARIREKQKAGDFKAMAAQITDDHIATFATESTWDGLADALVDKYEGIATRIVLYNALGDQERFERYGAVARRISTPDPRPGRPHPAASALSKPH